MTWFCSPKLVSLIFTKRMSAASTKLRQDMEENETNVTAEMADDDDDDAEMAPAPPAEEQLEVDDFSGKNSV